MSPNPAPTREGLARLRRVARTRKSLSGFTQWFLGTGILLLLAFVLAFWLAIVDLGFHSAYRILLGMDAPWEHTEDGQLVPVDKYLSIWAVSLIGWAAMPAIIGGAAGYIISRRIDGYTHTVVPELFAHKRTKLLDRLSPPPLIPWIKNWPDQLRGARTVAIARSWRSTRCTFVDLLVETGHTGDWRTAQKHWELTVAAYLNSPEFSEMGRRRKLASSTGAALLLLVLVIANTDSCLICEVQKDRSFI